MSGGKVGSVIGGLAGGLIGGQFGAPGLGIQIGSTLGGALDKSMTKQPRNRPPNPENINVSTAAYGVGIPKIYGNAKVGGNYIFLSNIIASDLDGVRADFAVMLCEGPVSSVLKVWANEVEIYDAETGWKITERFGSFTILLGTGDESVPGNYRPPSGSGFDTFAMTAHRRRCWIWFDNCHLLRWGNTLPAITALVATNATEVVPFEPIEIATTIQVPQESTPFSGQIHVFTGFENGHEAQDNADGMTSGDPHGGGLAGRQSIAWDCDGDEKYFGMQPSDTPRPDISGGFGTTNVYCAFWVRVLALGSGVGALCEYVTTGGTSVMGVSVTGEGLVQIRSHLNAVVGTSTTALRVGIWERIDLHHNSSSIDYELKINGVLEISVNASVSPSAIGIIRFGEWRDDLGTGFSFEADDAVGCTGDWFPDGDFYVSAFTGVGGTESVRKTACNNDPQDPGPPPWWNALLDDDGCADHHKPAGDHSYIVSRKPVQRFETVHCIKSFIVGSQLLAVGAPTISTIWRKDAVISETTSDPGGFPGSGNFAGMAMYYQANLSYNPAGGVPWDYDQLVNENPPPSTVDFTWPDEPVCSILVGGGTASGSGTRITFCALYVLHGTIETAAERTGPGDNLCFLSDNYQLWICFKGSWDLYNCSLHKVTVRRVFQDGVSPILPIDGCDFDIGKALAPVAGDDGHSTTQDRVWSCKWDQSSDPTRANVVRCSARSLAVELASAFFVYTPTLVRVCRNTDYPFLAVIHQNGTELLIMDRTTLDWYGSSYTSVDGPSGYQMVSMHWDDDAGLLYVLAVDDSSSGMGSTQVGIVRPVAASVPEVTWVDISTEIQYGTILRWDSAMGLLMVGTKDTPERICRYSVSSNFDDLDFLDQLEGNVVPEMAKSAWRRETYDFSMIYAYDQGGENIIKINLSEFVVEQTWTVDNSAGTGPPPDWLGGNVWDFVENTIITGCDLEDEDYCRVFFRRSVANAVTLKSIVESICLQSGLTAPQIDASELLDIEVWGYAIHNRTTYRQALQALMDTYFFDAVESQGTLEFRLRGRESVATLVDADLGAHEDGAQIPQLLDTDSTQSDEIPSRVEVGYIDYQHSYDRGVERAWYEIDGNGDFALDHPVSLTRSEAKQIAEKHMGYIVAAGREHSIAVVTWEHLALEPTDVITATARGVTRLLRIESVQFDDEIMTLECTNEDTAVYEQDSTVDTLPVPPTNNPGPTLLALFDTGLLASSDNTPGCYIAVAGFLDTWTGAKILRSVDGGASYDEWAIALEQGAIGSATTALGDVASPWIWDNGSTVTVLLQMDDQELVSATEAQVLAGANLAILGGEQIQFTTATLVGTNLYELSGLLRGRNGTEWATGTHAVGETFVLLGASRTDFHDLEYEVRNDTMQFIAVSLGTVEVASSPIDFACDFRNMKPWSPTMVEGERDGSDNLTVTWIRRSRIGQELPDGSDVPLFETTEAYEVVILNELDVALRTISATTPTVTYTAAQQSTDGLTPGEPVTLVVYQMSSVVGRGFGTRATL